MPKLKSTLPKPKPAPPPPKAKKSVSTKQFTVAAWTGAGEGEKVIVYGVTGKGKTSLCRLLPNAVFIGSILVVVKCENLMARH